MKKETQATDTKKTSTFKKRKKIKKNITSGIMFIQCLIIQLFLLLMKMEMSCLGLQPEQKVSRVQENLPYAAQIAADDAGSIAYEQGLRTLTVQVKGPGSGRETALRSLQSKGFKILSIRDTTPMPHNGARPPKRRRV